jgi:hypothetical protein
MSAITLKLFCIIYPSVNSVKNPFSVLLANNETVIDLKNAIKLKASPSLNNYTASELTLYNVSIPDDDSSSLAEKLAILQLEEGSKLNHATWDLSKFIKEEPLEEHIHIVVQVPSAGKLCIKPHSTKFL